MKIHPAPLAVQKLVAKETTRDQRRHTTFADAFMTGWMYAPGRTQTDVQRAYLLGLKRGYRSAT